MAMGLTIIAILDILKTWKEGNRHSPTHATGFSAMFFTQFSKEAYIYTLQNIDLPVHVYNHETEQLAIWGEFNIELHKTIEMIATKDEMGTL